MAPAVEAEVSAAASIRSSRSDTNVLVLDNPDVISPVNSPPLAAGDSQNQPAPDYGMAGERAWSAHGFYSLPGSRDQRREDLQPPEDGVLNEQWLQKGLKNIGKIAEGAGYCFLDLFLTSLDLKDISIVSNLPLLQNVNLSFNKLRDLSPLSALTTMVYLDVSSNMLESLESLGELKNLRKINASSNLLVEIGDMSRFPALQHLSLENNRIEEISGIQQNRRLKFLSLGQNAITSLQNIEDTPIRYLNVSGNKIRDLSQIQTLNNIEAIDFSYNQVSDLTGLRGRHHLQCVDAQNNNLCSFEQLAPLLSTNKLLRILNLRNNDIQEVEDYRLLVLYKCSSLVDLDHHKVSPTEKVAAINKFSPPPEVVASRDHINQVVYKYLQPTRLRECTLPSSETPYPLLVLVGPEGSGKIELANRIVQEFPDFFGYLPNHVVRRPEDSSVLCSELEQTNACLTEDQFVQCVKDGKFVSTYNRGGRTYGVMYDVIDSIASEGLACVTHMEYEGVLSFKKSFFQPRYLLVLQKTREVHESVLRDTYEMNDREISEVMKRVELYQRVNRENPGFFDQVIDSDSVDAALAHLSSIVKEYLGLPADYTAPSLSTSGGDRASTGGGGATSGGPVANNALRYKLGGMNASGSVKRRADMNSVELRSQERRESAMRAVVRENSLTPESPYGNVVYGPPYTAPAAVESRDSRKLDTPQVQDPQPSQQEQPDDKGRESPGSPIERPDLDEAYFQEKLQEKANALLEDDAMLDSEILSLFKSLGKSQNDSVGLSEGKELMKNYFQTNLFEIQFGEEDDKKFEASFYTYSDIEPGRDRDMDIAEFKQWFLYMLRMIKFGLYANQ